MSIQYNAKSGKKQRQEPISTARVWPRDFKYKYNTCTSTKNNANRLAGVNSDHEEIKKSFARSLA